MSKPTWTPMKQYGDCISCEDRVEVYEEKGLLRCKRCHQIIRAVESKDPAQSSLPLD